ncbi:MAG: ATP-binding protein [Actinobacteria bacterium]|nr:ATP-binding protein [Actinomycetota bacterium]
MPSSDKKGEDIAFYKRFSTFSESLIEKDLGSGFFKLGIQEAEKRQAKHDIRWVEDALLELLRNSRDAKATAIAVGTSLHEGRYREIIVIDNGIGIPDGFHEIIFEPRVTSRVKDYVEDEYGVHGRGMALYSIRLNAGDARVCYSKPYAGTSIRVLFDLQVIPERKNQAEKPKIVKTSEGYEIKGQKNILFTILDFYLKHPDIEVYLGSPAEVIALISNHASFNALRSANELKNFDADGLVDFARKLGIQISQRTAYRILSGEVSKPVSIGKQIRRVFSSGSTSKVSGILPEDWKVITEGVRKVLEPHLKRYSYELIEVKQIKSRGQIKIQVTLEPSEEF